MKFRQSDGVLTLHQSDIKDFVKCPEQARRSWGVGPDGLDPPTTSQQTDAASIGTVLHSVIEQDLEFGFPFKRVTEAQAFGRNTFGELITQYMENGDVYVPSSFGDDVDKCLGTLDDLVASWFKSKERAYWRTRDRSSYLLEEYFDVPFLDRPDGKIIKAIRLGGTIDLVDLERNELNDWKTASRPYQRWEHQRWDPQPTVYTYGAMTNGFVTPVDGELTFNFKVFMKKGIVECDTVTVQRSQGQWTWLTELVNGIALMIESDLPSWPLRDDGWWCSPKWCPFYQECKGVYVNATDWK